MSLTEPENVAGAIVFFGYIAAALFFSGLVGYDLIRLYQGSSNVGQPKAVSKSELGRRKNKAQIFLILAFVSFAVLSYHMLSFLIQSYSKWSLLSKLPLPKSLIGEEGIFSFGGKRTTLFLWSWSTKSTLFQTFAETLINDPQRYWWTQQTLLYSLGWNIFMAVEGTRRQIPRLWAYFVLNQILPISFTQNLFCAALFTKWDTAQNVVLRPAPAGDQFVVTFLYLLGLSTAPNTLGKTSFVFLIFALRGLLFAPYWMMRPSAQTSTTSGGGSSNGLYWQYRYSALVLVVGGIFLHIRQTQAVTSIAHAVKAVADDPAISALGYDYVLGVASLVILIVPS